MNRSKKLIIWVGILVLLCGSLFAVTYFNNNKEEEITETDDPIIISAVEKDNISHITLVNESGQFEFEKREVENKNADGETITSDEWILLGYEDYDINTYQIFSLESMFNSLNATREIEKINDETDLSKYGLDNPYATVTATLKDGEKIVFTFGNKTPEGYAYYFNIEGNPTVYTVSSNFGVYVGYTINDFRNDTIDTIDTTMLTYLYIDLNDHDTIEIVMKDEDDESLLGTHKLIQPYKVPKVVDSYDFEELITANFPTVSIDDYIDDNPTDLSLYGLDDPQLIFIAEGLDQEGKVQRMDYQFGDIYTDENGVEYIYFKPSDKNIVYAMVENDLLTKIAVDPFSLCDSLIYIVNILEVDQIKVSGLGKEFTLQMEREYNTVEKDDGTKEEEVTETFYIDGKVIEEDLFRDIYQLVIGHTGDFEVRGDLDLSNSDKVTLHYYLADGSEKIIEYYSYPEDNNFYIIPMEENLYYAISSDEIRTMFNVIEKTVTE